MVFSSVPAYLDPHNWQQQPVGGPENNHRSPPPVPGGGGGTATSIRPGSMAERARIAKLPQPETALKCPRCDSSNTKFCYYNNYSLSQPRHFCKTCRRYWTRGGALRNVPVGGGCRRNKRSKVNRSKSPVTADRQASSTSAATTNMIRHLQPPPSQLPLLPSLPHLGIYGGVDFAGVQPPAAVTGGLGGSGNGGGELGFHAGSGTGILSARFAEQWRLQHFPFSGSLEQSCVMYPFEGGDSLNGQLLSKPLDSGIGDQVATVKIEQNHQGLNLTRNLGIVGNEHQYWSGNAWSDLPGFTTSSTGHLM